VVYAQLIPKFSYFAVGQLVSHGENTGFSNLTWEDSDSTVSAHLC